MSFNHVVLQNILRDKQTYISYFLSSVFSIVVFFLFMLIAQHPMLAQIDSSSTMGLAMMLVSLFVYIFSFVFIIYSLFAFLKKKTKSLGIFMISGASMKQVRTLVFRENMLIGGLAIVTAIILGLVIGPLFLMIMKKVLGADQFGMYIPIVPIIVTIIMFTVLFFIVSKFMTRFINKEQAIQLLKADVTPEKTIKKNFVAPIISCMAMTSLGAMIYIFDKNMYNTSLTNMLYLLFFLVMLLTIYLFILQGLRFMINKWQHQTNFYQKTHMLFTTNMKAKGKSYGNIMFLLTVLLLGIFACTSILFSSYYNVKQSVESVYPYSFQYISLPDNTTKQQDIKKIETILDAKVNYKTFTSEFKSMEDRRIGFFSQSAYNALGLAENISISDKEYYVSAGNKNSLPDVTQLNLDVLKGLTHAGTYTKNILVEGFQHVYIVLPDALYEQMKLPTYSINAFEVEKWDQHEEIAAEVLAQVNTVPNEHLFGSKIHLYTTEKEQKGLLFFIGAMLSLLFISAAMSILYFYLQTIIEAEKEKYAAIRKVGLSLKEISTVLKKELAILIFVPFIIVVGILSIGLIGLSSWISATFLMMMGCCLISFLVLFIVGYKLIHKAYLQKIVS